MSLFVSSCLASSDRAASTLELTFTLVKMLSRYKSQNSSLAYQVKYWLEHRENFEQMFFQLLETSTLKQLVDNAQPALEKYYRKVGSAVSPSSTFAQAQRDRQLLTRVKKEIVCLVCAVCVCVCVCCVCI